MVINRIRFLGGRAKAFVSSKRLVAVAVASILYLGGAAKSLPIEAQPKPEQKTERGSGTLPTDSDEFHRMILKLKEIQNDPQRAGEYLQIIEQLLGFIKDEITRNPDGMKAFLQDMVRLATKASPGSGIEVETYANAQLKHEMERLRRESNVAHLQEQEKQIADLNKEIARLQKRLKKLEPDASTQLVESKQYFLSDDFTKYAPGAFPPAWGGEAEVIEDGKAGRCLGTHRAGNTNATRGVEFPENWSMELMLFYGDHHDKIIKNREEYKGAMPFYNARPPYSPQFIIHLTDTRGRTYKLDIAERLSRESESLSGRDRYFRGFGISLSDGATRDLVWPAEKLKIVKKGNSLAIYAEDKYVLSGQLSDMSRFSRISITLHFPDEDRKMANDFPIWLKQIRAQALSSVDQ